MKCPSIVAVLATASVSLALLALPACEKPAPAPNNPPPKPAPADSHDGHDHDHDHDDHDHGHGGKVIDLGAAVAGSFNVKATRDDGQIVAGKDAPIDVTVTPAAAGGGGSTAKVGAVRFWIGAEDAKGSVKAKADVEDPKEPNRWHTHAEIPSPIPTGAKLWVEVEDDKGQKVVTSFDLKM